MWLPVLSVFSPVVPLWAVSSFSTFPSIRRSKRPASVVGLTFLTTSSLPVLRVLVIVHTMSEPSVTFTVSGPGLPELDATTVPAPLSPLHTIDFR